MPPSILPLLQTLRSHYNGRKSTGDAEFFSSNPLEERPEKSFQSDPLGSVPLAYDFKRPQSVNKDRIRAVESLHEQFSRLFFIDVCRLDAHGRRRRYGLCRPTALRRVHTLPSYTVWRLHIHEEPTEAKLFSA